MVDEPHKRSMGASSATAAAPGIPIVEHLTGLERLPDRGFEVTALPPRIEGMGTFPVRAVARITG
jgi:kynurenine formamidase